jgi:hypothetical protein
MQVVKLAVCDHSKSAEVGDFRPRLSTQPLIQSEAARAHMHQHILGLSARDDEEDS